MIVLNKALNDMVHVARANAGLDKLSDSKSEAEPTQSVVATLRRIARFVPFHRLYHSVELTILAFVASIVGLFLPALLADRILLLVLLPLAVLALGGHPRGDPRVQAGARLSVPPTVGVVCLHAGHAPRRSRPRPRVVARGRRR